MTFAPSTRRIYVRSVRVTIGLGAAGLPRPRTAASYAVRVPRAGALPPASFPPHLAAVQLLSARGSRHQGPQRTSTSQSLPGRLSPPGCSCRTRARRAMPGAPGKAPQRGAAAVKVSYPPYKHCLCPAVTGATGHCSAGQVTIVENPSTGGQEEFDHRAMTTRLEKLHLGISILTARRCHGFLKPHVPP